MSPRVSVLLPVRDSLAYLPESVGSILATPPSLPLELIAVDDGSRDGARAWLAHRAEDDPRLRLIDATGRGIVSALNQALAAARAPVVARMDADDRSLPGRLEASLSLLETRPDLGLVGCGVELHPEGLQGDGMRHYVAWLNGLSEPDLPAALWVESPLAHPTIAARRQVLLDCGGYRDGDFAEDYELLLRLHQGGVRFGRVRETLYWWRDHPPRLTRTDPRYAPPTFRKLKARYLAEGPLGGRGEVAMWGAGKTGRPFARALAAHGIRIKLWLDVDPRKSGVKLHGAPILPITEVERARGLPLIVAVGAKGARDLIRAELARNRFEELRDYWVVA